MTPFALDFSLQQGAFNLSLDFSVTTRAIALFGPSGSGKTSALEAIAGLRVPSRGRITIGGRALFDAAAHLNVPVRSRGVGYVPQDVLLFPHLTVEENVRYGHGGGRIALADILDLLDLAPLMPRRIDALSGGERQRAALARALYSNPALLLLDEPLAAVDLGRRRRIIDALLRIRDDLNLPIIYVTHSPEEAAAIADHVVMLEGGRVATAGPAREVLALVDSRYGA